MSEPAARTIPLPPGRIDIHSHAIPGIDDGCDSPAETLTCVERLKAAGFVGSICTPHIWPEQFPGNTPDEVERWTGDLQRRLDEQGAGYRLWAGGELRLFRDVIDWLKAHGVPTLAGSDFVLADLWEQRWPRWADAVFDWLIEQGYRPILAHPERLAVPDLPDRLDALSRRGVLMQGNFRCMTGEEGFLADQWVRQFLSEGRYTFLAMDMHRPDTLGSRLEGMALVEREFGREVLDEMTMIAPRRLILGEADGTAGEAGL